MGAQPGSLRHRLGLDAQRGHRVSPLRPDSEPDARSPGEAAPTDGTAAPATAAPGSATVRPADAATVRPAPGADEPIPASDPIRDGHGRLQIVGPAGGATASVAPDPGTEPPARDAAVTPAEASGRATRGDLRSRLGITGPRHRVSALRPDTEPAPRTEAAADLPTGETGAAAPSARLAPDGARPPRATYTPRAYASATAAARPLTNLPLDQMSSTSAFGKRSDPIEGETRQHNGIDLGAKEGTPVRAAGSGIVKFAGEAGTYGNLVVVDHGGGLETRYAHLKRIDVLPGQVLAAGAKVGGVGQTGRATGPHLHFEVRRDGQPSDPSSEFSASSLASAGRPTDWR
jgi:murein DD-endopeptidase MepM/ murein hydrolase activator NlpD